MCFCPEHITIIILLLLCSCLLPSDYEPIPALPPCLMHSHTLPRRTELSRRYSQPVSTPAGPSGNQAIHNFPAIPRADPGLHNIRTFDPRLFNLSSLPQPRVSVTNASFDETDSAPMPSGKQDTPFPTQPSSVHTRSVTPETPRSPSAPSTPQKIIQSYPGTPSPPPGQERGGRRGGGLQGAMTRYQENRRKSRPSSKSGNTSGTVSPALSTEGGIVIVCVCVIRSLLFIM